MHPRIASSSGTGFGIAAWYYDDRGEADLGFSLAWTCFLLWSLGIELAGALVLEPDAPLTD